MLLILAGPSATVYAQNSIRVDAGVWYSDKQDINCLRCLVTEAAKNAKIVLISDEIGYCRADLSISVDLNEAQRIENNELNESVKKLRKWLKIASGGFIAAVLVVVVLLL